MKVRSFMRGALAAALSVIMTSTAFGAVFRDTRMHWAASYIDKWSAAGVVVGYPDGNFLPDNNITKAEFSSVLNQIFKYTALSANTFADVPAGAWYASIIQKLAAAGVTSPDASGKIYPDSAITRGELFVMIAKAYNIAPVSGSTSFLDNGQINSSQRPYVKALQDKGLVVGYSVNGGYEIRTNRLITRAEMLTVLEQAANGAAEAPGVITAAVSGPPVNPPGHSTGYPSTTTQSTPTPTPTPKTVVEIGGGDVGEPVKDEIHGYSYQVTVTSTIAELDVSFVMVVVTPNDPAKTVSSVTVMAGSKSFRTTYQEDGNAWRAFVDNGAWTAAQITVEAVLR